MITYTVDLETLTLDVNFRHRVPNGWHLEELGVDTETMDEMKMDTGARIDFITERLEGEDLPENLPKGNKRLPYYYEDDESDYEIIFTKGDKLLMNVDSLRKFFRDRGKVSPSYISEEAGFSAKYLRLILSGERPLTDTAIAKLEPVLHLHGWGRERKEKE